MKNAERKLTEMQRLYEQLEANHQNLQALNQRLPELIKQMKRLRELYQCDWLESVERVQTDEAACERINQIASSGYYSVLGEDTIWDTLAGTDQETKKLLRQLIDLLA